MTLDRATFLDVMTTFPTGVAIVTTTDAEGLPYGFTSNAVSSVSADPPMLLVCVALSSRTLPVLLDRGAFLVNFMGEGTVEACNLFASKAEPQEKFAAIEWASRADRLPHLHRDGIAYASCRVEHTLEAGSHVVVVARIVEGAVTDPNRRPIAYYKRQYGSWPVDPAGRRRLSRPDAGR